MERALPQEHSTQPSGTGEVTHLRCWSQELELGCLYVCAEDLAAKPSVVGWPPSWGWHQAGASDGG